MEWRPGIGQREQEGWNMNHIRECEEVLHGIDIGT